MERVAKYSPEEIVAKLGLKPVTTYQSEIISSPLEPSVVIAGAGSGKTETMSNRVLYLVANGFVTPDQILGLTFTRKAAGEPSVRIRKRLRQLAADKDFTHLYFPGTGDFYYFAGGFVAVIFRSIEPVFIFCAERYRKNFDKHPVFFWPWYWCV